LQPVCILLVILPCFLVKATIEVVYRTSERGRCGAQDPARPAASRCSTVPVE